MTIKRKLILLTILPTMTILLFSINHIIDKYKVYNNHKHLLLSSTIIDNTANVLHALQKERGLITCVKNNIDIESNRYFKDQLIKQQEITDVAIEEFIDFFKKPNINSYNIVNTKFTDKVTILLRSIKELRENIQDNTITPYNIFKYFSYINSQLVELSEGIKFYLNDEKAQNNIMFLKKLLYFQELSGQERALVALINNKILSPINFDKFDTIWTNQGNIYDNIKIISNTSDLNSKLNNIKIKFDDSYIQDVRAKITKSIDKKLSINSKIWYDETTNMINDYHELGRYVYSQIVLDINNKNNKLYNSLIYQAAFTIIAIFTLLLGALSISKNINRSLRELDHGIDNFFDFLNFKSSAPKKIDTNSKDELSNMAGKINNQISCLEQNLENDHKFIRETTQIVQKMHNGTFHEKSHTEPASPYLVNLKIVFNELTSLISDKITQQTISLEKLNETLEDKVYYQTAELEDRIAEITLARDAAIEAEKSKDMFLANMSHEIRTPLNAILGFVNLLSKRTNDDKSLEYLNIIDSSGESLLNIINDLLDFSKIQSGKFNIASYDIDPMIEFSNTTLIFASKAYEKNITYAVYIDPKMPKKVSVDYFRVKQILSNLLSNAIKFTPKDGVISIYIVIKGNFIILSVQDNGIGIPLNAQLDVFKPFLQADLSTTRKYGGTGLGLSISSKLAQLMDGSITLLSQEGIGSTFTLKVPINITDTSTKSLINLDKIAKYKIAILDSSKEHQIFTELIKKYLTDLGINNIIELSEFKADGHDILFFIPDDSCNKKILQKNIPAIAILKSGMTNLPETPNLKSISAPFTPISITKAINDITNENIKIFTEIKEKTTDKEVKFYGRVLIAEDNKTNQLLLSLMLDEYNIEHHIVENGKQAVEVFKQEKFDLVLMDEDMPELNGIASMIQIKEYEIQNNLKKTPIIAVTANALVTDVKKFLDAGMDGFVAKPINNLQLETELKKHLTKV